MATYKGTTSTMLALTGRSAVRPVIGCTPDKAIDVGRAGTESVLVAERGSHDNRVPGDRHGRAELIARRCVVGRKFGTLRPVAPAEAEYIHRTGVQTAVVVTARGDGGNVSAYGGGVSELIQCGPVVGEQLGLFDPSRTVVAEDVLINSINMQHCS